MYFCHAKNEKGGMLGCGDGGGFIQKSVGSFGGWKKFNLPLGDHLGW